MIKLQNKGVARPSDAVHCRSTHCPRNVRQEDSKLSYFSGGASARSQVERKPSQRPRHRVYEREAARAIQKCISCYRHNDTPRPVCQSLPKHTERETLFLPAACSGNNALSTWLPACIYMVTRVRDPTACTRAEVPEREEHEQATNVCDSWRCCHIRPEESSWAQITSLS